MRNHLFRYATLALLPSLVAVPAVAQDDGWCEETRHWDHDRAHYCEVREFTIRNPARALRVDGGTNGGVQVEGWDESFVRVEARVSAWARSERDAADLASRIRIDEGTTIRADGPSTGRREGWAVSFRVFVPRRTDLDLRTHNGGITLADVNGRVRFDALNGGVHLERLGGDVQGQTTNGGLHVVLTGSGWTGDGLDVRTTNGGVRLYVPDDYNAHVVTGTVNGGITVDFPVMFQGRLRRTLEFDLGHGGRTVRATTTNGSVRLARR